MTLESNNSMNTYEDGFANISADGETVRKPVENIQKTDDVARNVPVHRKSYAEIVQSGINGDVDLRPLD